MSTPARCSLCDAPKVLLGTPEAHARVCVACDFRVTSFIYDRPVRHDQQKRASGE